MPATEKATEAAQKHFAQLYGKQRHRIVRTESDKHPNGNQSIHRFLAVRSNQGNTPAEEVIIDDDGNIVQMGSERARVFLADVKAVPHGLVSASKVTVNPAVNNLRLGECDVFHETITVDIPASAAVAPADIYFLSDNTGSMTPAISAVQAGANAIFAALSGYPGLQFGVGEYQDFENVGDIAFKNLQPITTNHASVTSAIGAWVAVGGGDGPEAQLYALDQVASLPGIGWRPGVKHIVVWMGDAPGHDPICAAASGIGYSVTEASVTTKLKAGQFTVLAISLNDGPLGSGGSGYANGLNDDPTNLESPLNPAYAACGNPGGTPGQATRIAAATSGIVVNSVDPTAVVSVIIAQLKALLTINNVHLEPVGAIAPFVTSITPPSYGPLPGDKPNVLKFEVTFNGDVVDCATRDRVFTGAIDVVVDGAVAAAKPTRITVPACKYTYAVKFVCGAQTDCDCRCAPVRPGVYATEINILNPKCKEANIVKRFVPLVFAGAVTGREPAVATAKATDKIVLPSGAATMDDCCRIAELLYGGALTTAMPLTIGFLEIISDQELHVTAVYTASDSEGHGLSVNVLNVPGKLT
jgi:hypothetical protein